MDDSGDSDCASDVDVQPRKRESDCQPTPQTSAGDGHRRSASVTAPQPDGGVGHRVKASRSVLALVLDDECVFAGLQGGDIVAWSLETFDLILSVHAHKESVLSLYLSEDGTLLFSSGGDSVVNVWSTRTFERLYSIYSHHDVGDIFAVVYSSNLQTVYCGCQNTSIQWCDISASSAGLGNGSTAHPSRRTHRFFDSRGPDGRRAPRPDSSSENMHSITEGGQVLTFKRDHHKLFAHHGYVYSMLLIRGLVEGAATEEVLLTGAGDGAVKLWRVGQKAGTSPVQMAKLQNGDSVLSIAVDGSLLYCGLAGGALNIWNLDTQQLVKRITEHTGDLWAVDIIRGVAVCGDSRGIVKRFNSRFDEVGSWVAHDGTMLASAAGRFNDRLIYATGGNDNTVGIWDLTDVSVPQENLPPISNDEMVNSLADLVAFRTISSSPRFAGECNQAAAWLRRHCNYLGSQTKLLTTGDDTNPIVYARFQANAARKAEKTVLFYGHYDIVGADTNRPDWKTNPYHLTSINGFLYGRGVTDNKGPILAALYAAAELTRQKSLPCDVVFLIEGEEESGSQGFHEAVRKNKDLIGEVHWILLANSYWLDDFNPCLTYGLRGVVHANLIVSSAHPDLHSGIDGSSLLDEPLKDLSMLLGTLVGSKGRINLPGFHDPVLPLSEEEKLRYTAIAEAILPHHPEITDSEAFIRSLMYRWREPSLTIHSIEVPGSKSATTTISRKAKASLSIRIVPNQEADEVAANLTVFAQEQFALLDSNNDLTVEITGKSDPWLGDPNNEIFETLAEAISEAWTPDRSRSKRTYPAPSGPSARATLADRPLNTTDGRKELLRGTSSESLASHIDRIISSSTTDGTQRRKRSAGGNLTIPTSSTLAKTTTTATTGTSSTDSRQSTETTAAAAASPPSPPLKPRHESSQQIPQQHLQPAPTTTATTTTPSPPSTTRVVKPIYIREGGSIPTIRFLEKEFSAPAANLPCGQASDNAHLSNERLRVENLFKSREIFRFVFEKLSARGGEGKGVSD